MGSDDILVLVMLVVFIGGIAWVSRHSKKTATKDESKD